MTSHAAVIINATSGAGDKEDVREHLTDFFKSRDAGARVLFARDGAEIESLARRAVEDDCSPIIAGGGDGTINAVASHVVGTTRPLGVLP
ncbi:MAG: diacylglycerol kinase family lipid kinase, partial [Acidobacteria bacterium]|nr:diacylglycerol kinase family lipid kinase [Acidobacteriota bacterium]